MHVARRNLTLYRLYVENGNRAGFWVQHRNWLDICARVQSIGGQAEGKLPGAAPTYDHAEVILRFFDVRSGRPILAAPDVTHTEDRSYSRIAEPFWRHARRDV